MNWFREIAALVKVKTIQRFIMFKITSDIFFTHIINSPKNRLNHLFIYSMRETEPKKSRKNFNNVLNYLENIAAKFTKWIMRRLSHQSYIIYYFISRREDRNHLIFFTWYQWAEWCQQKRGEKCYIFALSGR